MMYLFAISVFSYLVRLLMFYNVQATNLTFVGKNETYNK